MQIVFGDGGGRWDLDVRVNNPSATVSDLARALDPRGREGPLVIDGRLVDADLGLLREAGLYEGVVVELPVGGALRPPLQDTAPAVELRVVNGLDAGRHHRLEPGRTLLGRDHDCDVVLDHRSVSHRHATLDVTRAGHVTVVDHASHNGTWLDSDRVAEARARPVPDGALLRLGAFDVEVGPVTVHDRPVLNLRRELGAAGTVPFNRPPLAAPPAPLDDVEPPQPPPSTTSGSPVSVISIVTPLLLAGVMFAVMRQVHFLLFAALSPVMMIGNAVDGRRRGRRSARQQRERFGRELDELREELRRRADEERARRRTLYPDPAEIVRRVTLPSTALWERRPDHPQFLRLRAGLGSVAWHPPVKEAQAGRLAEEVAAVVAEASTLPRAAVPVDLSGGGVVGIVGDRRAALALARSLLCQAAVLHGPSDLPAMVLADRSSARDWDWAKWLPHTRGPSGVDRMLSCDRELSTRMVEARLDAARSPSARRPRSGTGVVASATGPTLLVVVDDESLTTGRQAPTRRLLSGEGGPVAGIVLASSTDRLPAACTSIVELDGGEGRADLVRPRSGERVDGFVVAGMVDAVARDCARTMARYEDPELDLVGAGLPPSIRLLPLLDLEDAGVAAIRARWKQASHDPASLATPIGVEESGTLLIDLVAEGPHGLVGGTTGAGKSELLRTIVAGLAACHDPDRLTFVLIDFKGGSAFDVCADLPHTVGLVTDLDEHLAERALRCLDAELRHREKALRAAGASDLIAYDRDGTAPEPLPRLVVVIDEFATLKAELPHFVDALVGIAQRGRSLGVHLLLATQRPQGAISENIKANTNLRVALRVQDRGDSTDIVDVPDAADIPRSLPGRAYVRVGPGEVTAIQTALATGARSDGSLAPVDVAPFVFGPNARVEPAGTDTSNGVADSTDGSGTSGLTDLAVLVDAIGAAFGDRPRPRRPWPEPLPPDVDLALLAAAAATPGAGAPAYLPLALADDPDVQSQYPMGWKPADGNLLVYGVGGSGTTTTASTLALSLAASYPPDDLHLYVVDMGARELEDLGALPHVGAVVNAAERERQTRLVRYLREEMARRLQLGAAVVAGLPAIVLVIDGWSALAAEYDDLAGGAVLDGLQRIFADGPAVRIHMVITADRVNAVPPSMASLAGQRLALHLPDPHAYSAFGIRAGAVPAMPPGRALVGGTGQLVQIARPAAGVRAEVARLAAAAPTPTRRPPAVEVLAETVAIADVGGVAQLGDRPWTLPIGIAEASLEPAALVAYQGEHALIAGPARSGKTTALLTVAAAFRRTAPDTTVLALAGPRSVLATDDRLVDEVLPPSAVGPELTARVEASARTTLLLVDDAETVDDVGDTLARLSTSDRPDLLVVAAGRSDALRQGYTHWTRQLRRSRSGVLLMPQIELDGDLFGTQLPRRAPVQMVPGRGYLVASGQVELVQLALPS